MRNKNFGAWTGKQGFDKSIWNAPVDSMIGITITGYGWHKVCKAIEKQKNARDSSFKGINCLVEKSHAGGLCSEISFEHL